jgi:hypothetical protein
LRYVSIGTCIQETLLKAKKDRLIALGYPWPEQLEWLDAEIKCMTTRRNAPSKVVSPVVV